MNQIAINTSQNVNIDFTLASIGDRMFAFIIDTIIKILYLLIIYYIMDNFFGLARYAMRLDSWSAVAINIIISLPVIFYTLFFESTWEGQTPGKKLRKIKVVKIDGYQASFGDYLIRWVFNLIDIYLDSGIVGLVSMIVSKDNQRLGNMASGTAVISLKNNVKISHTILEELKEDYIPLFPQVIALSDNDMRIIKDNFNNAIRIGDWEIVSKLSQKVKGILKIESLPHDLTEKEFIKIVIKDYNFYTGKDS